MEQGTFTSKDYCNTNMYRCVDASLELGIRWIHVSCKEISTFHLREGFNHFASPRSRHSEETAIEGLRINRGKIKKINMLVIRPTIGSSATKYKLSSAKPCASCIGYIRRIRARGYSINKIYYSTNEGVIVKSNLNQLLSEEMHVSRNWR